MSFIKRHKTVMVFIEEEVDATGRALAVLFDEKLSDICVLIIVVVLMVIIRAVDKHDDIGILLDRAGIAEVGKNRLWVVAAGYITRELGEGDDWDFELTSEGLETTRNFSNLLNTISGIAVSTV